MDAYPNPDSTPLLNETLSKQSKAKPIDRRPGTWLEIRLFISSTFIDTHAERDILIKQVIPSLNRRLADKLIRVVPVDLRWGVLNEESSDCKKIQKTCLNQIDECRIPNLVSTPWFLGLRTNRYGWVQDQYAHSKEFEQPEYYAWLDKLSELNQLVSITSLEVMHATVMQGLRDSTVSPTVFFYHRTILNDENNNMISGIPEHRRWIFDFEFVDREIENLEIKNQYTVDKISSKYAADHEILNEFLRNEKKIIFREYSCRYEYSKITGERSMKDGSKKMFGVGYTKDLQDFQKMTEDDLYNSIINNYVHPPVISDSFELERIQHENAIGLKASTFVGRTALVDRITKHCNEKGGDSVMILHGEPGCGKSGIISKVADKCIKKDSEDFLFVHAVDTCPGSTLIEGMLRRIRHELKEWRKKHKKSDVDDDDDDGDNDDSDDYDDVVNCSFNDIRKQHMEFMIETAKLYPHHNFTFIIDAVNQLNSAHQAWDMWWIPGDGIPENVKFLISTLTQENDTFENAIKIAPIAVVVEVDEMSEDLSEMVTISLGRFNKKLTTKSDGMLGNQMEMLLSKSKSPLFLNSACEALRRFGIYEKLSDYIIELPTNTRDLFKFLILEWKTEYGEDFVNDILGILAISKDGLLENQINDFMIFREEKLGILYDANFSRIYDGLNSFLAAGGGGYLRYFHDQLKYVVQEMLDDCFIKQLHKHLSEFFYGSICTQFTNKPIDEEKAAYHDHCLNQIVYHRINAGMCLKNTIRNIFFIRERVVAGQLQNLINDYKEAINVGDENVSIYNEWRSFSQIYAHRIEEFPHLAYNMAVNQSKVSTIRKDTKEMYLDCEEEGVLYWSNRPNKVDAIVAKYPYDGLIISGCKNIVAIARGLYENVVLLDAFSGEVIHELVGCKAQSVCLDDSGDKAYCGGWYRKVSRWDVSTGVMEWSIPVCDGKLIWTHLTQKYLLVGGIKSGYRDDSVRVVLNSESEEIERRIEAYFNVYDYESAAVVLNRDDGEIVRRIEIGECVNDYHYDYNCGYDYDYAYLEHESVEILLATKDDGDITGWNIHSGEKMFTVHTGHEDVCSISVHPTLPRFICGGSGHYVHEYEITDDASNVRKVEERSQIVDTGDHEKKHDYSDDSDSDHEKGNTYVSYDHSGDRVLTTEHRSRSVRIYSPTTGKLLEEMRDHPGEISNIRLHRDGVHVLTTGSGCSILYKLPDTDMVEEIPTSNAVETGSIKWVMFGKDGSVFYTATEGCLRAYDSLTLETLQVNDKEDIEECDGAISADGTYLVIKTGKRAISFFDIKDISKAFNDVTILPDRHEISSVTMSPDGTKLLVTDYYRLVVVLDISDVRNSNTHEIYKKETKGWVASGAIHTDSDTAAYGGEYGVVIFSIASKQTLKTIDTEGMCDFTRFMSTRHFTHRYNEELMRYDWVSDKYVINTGHLLYSNNYGDLIRYDWVNDKHVMTYKVGDVRAAILLKDSKEIVVATRDMIKVYDTEGNGQPKYAFISHQAQYYNCLHASPDEKTILAVNESGLYILKDKDN